MAEQTLRSASGSSAEDLFIELFSETFGAEKAGYLYTQYHFYDIYQNDRFADFYIENGPQRIAVEIGELVPVRCIRIHTNIDLTKVRFNSIQYNIRDLESKIFVPERNQLIVDTFMEYVSTKRTVIFCASVKHAEQIAEMIRERRVNAAAVSGSMKSSERKEFLAKFQKGDIKALCACDLLNEGWDCPETEVLFMARPTMSKVLYTQQLGRGMRLAEAWHLTKKAPGLCDIDIYFNT